jgi:hypothetical protein
MRKQDELDADSYSVDQRWRWWKYSRRAVEEFHLGPIGNTVAGILDGVGGGLLLRMLTGAVAPAWASWVSCIVLINEGHGFSRATCRSD